MKSGHGMSYVVSLEKHPAFSLVPPLIGCIEPEPNLNQALVLSASPPLKESRSSDFILLHSRENDLTLGTA